MKAAVAEGGAEHVYVHTLLQTTRPTPNVYCCKMNCFGRKASPSITTTTTTTTTTTVAVLTSSKPPHPGHGDVVHTPLQLVDR